MNILYLTYKENPFKGNKAIIQTQVQELLKLISKEINLTWLMVYNDKLLINKDDIAHYTVEMKNSGIKFVPIETSADNIYTGVETIIKDIKATIDLDLYDIIHCRGYAATNIALKTKNRQKILFDMRGVLPHESYVNSKFPKNVFDYVYWSRIEKSCIEKSDAVVVVTNYFKKYLCNKYKRIEDKVFVIYNSVNTKRIYFCENQRQSIRKQLKIESESTLVVYCGSIYDKWQSFGEAVDVFNVLKQAKGNIKFLILTKDFKINWGKYQLNPDEIITKYVDNTEIYKYLSASDIALLIRNKSIVNGVAFPVKFTEYMACGLPTIVSDSMNGICEMLENKGIVYNKDSPKVKTIWRINKEDCIKFADENLEVRINAQKYKDIYLMLGC